MRHTLGYDLNIADPPPNRRLAKCLAAIAVACTCRNRLDLRARLVQGRLVDAVAVFVFAGFAGTVCSLAFWRINNKLAFGNRVVAVKRA